MLSRVLDVIVPLFERLAAFVQFEKKGPERSPALLDDIHLAARQERTGDVRKGIGPVGRVEFLQESQSGEEFLETRVFEGRASENASRLVDLPKEGSKVVRLIGRCLRFKLV